MIGNNPAALNFNRFICNQRSVLPARTLQQKVLRQKRNQIEVGFRNEAGEEDSGTPESDINFPGLNARILPYHCMRATCGNWDASWNRFVQCLSSASISRMVCSLLDSSCFNVIFVCQLCDILSFH